MQPLISVEHESRQNAYRRDEEESHPSEHTPLLRFPQNELPLRSRSTLVMVFLLLLVLLAGIFIGAYLLVLQSESENILPPVQFPLQLEKRSAPGLISPAEAHMYRSSKAKYVIVVQTDTKQCFTNATCSELLHNLKPSKSGSLPYNFLVSSAGQNLEGLGCHQPSPMFPQYPHALVLAFIGNFTEVPPNRSQVQQAKSLLSECVSQQYLEPSFIIVGKKTKFSPTFLFRAMEEYYP